MPARPQATTVTTTTTTVAARTITIITTADRRNRAIRRICRSPALLCSQGAADMEGSRATSNLPFLAVSRCSLRQPRRWTSCGKTSFDPTSTAGRARYVSRSRDLLSLVAQIQRRGADPRPFRYRLDRRCEVTRDSLCQTDRRSSSGRGTAVGTAISATEGEADRGILLGGILEEQFDRATAAFLHTAAIALTDRSIAARTLANPDESVAVGQLFRLEYHHRLQIQVEHRRYQQRFRPEAHGIVWERERRKREQCASRTSQKRIEAGESQRREESVSICLSSSAVETARSPSLIECKSFS